MKSGGGDLSHVRLHTGVTRLALCSVCVTGLLGHSLKSENVPMSVWHNERWVKDVFNVFLPQHSVYLFPAWLLLWLCYFSAE